MLIESWRIFFKAFVFLVPAYQDNDSKERKCVLVALMTYNWTCLLDFVAVGLFIFLYEHILFQL